MFKNDSLILVVVLIEMLDGIWKLDFIQFEWSQLLSVPVYEERQKSSCDNRRGIGLTNIMSKILALIVSKV